MVVSDRPHVLLESERGENWNLQRKLIAASLLSWWFAWWVSCQHEAIRADV